MALPGGFTAALATLEAGVFKAQSGVDAGSGADTRSAAHTDIAGAQNYLMDHRPLSKSWLCKEFRTKKKLRNKRMYRLCLQKVKI